MTYPSRNSLISRGVGKSLRSPSGVAPAASSRMISVQRSIHSSQINTDEGPAISFLTSCWLLLQNEQCRTFSSADFFSDIDSNFHFRIVKGREQVPSQNSHSTALCRPWGRRTYTSRVDITRSIRP